MFTFTDALIIAAEAHRGVKDAGGIDYIKHPLHLAHQLKIKGYSNEAQITAVLHDVLEDSDVTIEELIRKKIPQSIADALLLLTHVKNKELIDKRRLHYLELGIDEHLSMIKAKEDEYFAYIYNIAKNDIARAVKIEDLTHNSDISRVTDTDLDKMYVSRRLIKYAKARNILTGGRVGY